jgi:Tripartite tricarboxylate transporter TctB family
LPKIRRYAIQGRPVNIKSQRDFFSGLMFIVVGVVFAVGATNYPMGTSAKPGAGYFPLILSVLMAMLGAVVLFKSLTIETEGGEPIGAVAWRPLLVIVAAIAVFGFSITRLGLALTVPILILITSLAGDEFKWLGVVVNAAVLTLFSWLIFVYGLKLNIPVWPSFIVG